MQVGKSVSLPEGLGSGKLSSEELKESSKRDYMYCEVKFSKGIVDLI
jgi:hypothetical protein